MIITSSLISGPIHGGHDNGCASKEIVTGLGHKGANKAEWTTCYLDTVLEVTFPLLTRTHLHNKRHVKSDRPWDEVSISLNSKTNKSFKQLRIHLPLSLTPLTAHEERYEA